MAPTLDPRRLAEIALAAAVRAQCDAVFVEPVSGDDETYALNFERGQKLLASVTVDALTGAATIARVAYLVDLDLAGSSPASAVLLVRSGGREAGVVVARRRGGGRR